VSKTLLLSIKLQNADSYNIFQYTGGARGSRKTGFSLLLKLLGCELYPQVAAPFEFCEPFILRERRERESTGCRQRVAAGFV